MNGKFGAKIRLWLALDTSNKQIEKTQSKIYLPNVKNVIFFYNKKNKKFIFLSQLFQYLIVYNILLNLIH